MRLDKQKLKSKVDDLSAKVEVMLASMQNTDATKNKLSDEVVRLKELASTQKQLLATQKQLERAGSPPSLTSANTSYQNMQMNFASSQLSESRDKALTSI